MPKREMECNDHTTTPRPCDADLFRDPLSFADALRPPLAADPRTKGSKPVFVHQQPYVDFRNGVVSKLIALRDLCRMSAHIEPVFLWIDTDRAASDKLGLRLYWPTPHGRTAIRFAPAHCDHREFRTIKLDLPRARRSCDHMRALVRQLPSDRQAALRRFERLRPHLLSGGLLSDRNRRCAEFLFAETLALRPLPDIASDLASSGALTEPLTTLFNCQAEYVRVFNDRLVWLEQRGIASGMKPLAPDHLPMFVTCRQTGARLRLRLVRSAGTSFAVANAPDGTLRKFELGRSPLTLDSIIANDGWSPDVCLPILVANRYSGMIAGRSSALYMQVLQHVMRKILGVDPIPVLSPSNWSPMPSASDSLVHAYLTGSTF